MFERLVGAGVIKLRSTRRLRQLIPEGFSANLAVDLVLGHHGWSQTEPQRNPNNHELSPLSSKPPNIPKPAAATEPNISIVAPPMTGFGIA